MGESTPATPLPDIQLFRDVFDASPIGIAVENLDGQPLFVNPALCSMLGFSEDELRGKHCVQFSPPDDAEKDWALFQKLRTASIDHYQLEKRYFRRDGSLVWGRLSLSLLNHRPSALVLALVEDITEKKTAEEARFRHAAIVESSEDAIASGTLDGIIVSWNAGAQRMYGYTEAEAVGKSIAMILPPELRDEENKILETLRAGGHVEHFETIRVTKTGKKINVSLAISPIKDATGRTVGISGIARDVTERKRGEEALAEVNRTLVAQAALLEAREELLRVFVKNVPAAVAMLDRDMRYLQVSDRWCSDNSVAASELLGRSREFSPEMPDRWKEVNRRALQGETLRADEDRWESGGSTRWARWEVRPWRAADGTVGGILIFAEDITRRKQMEEAISGVSGRLIEAQERERGRIARDLHDDICQQLALVSIQLEQVQRELPDSVSENRSQVGELRKRIIDISTDVQMMSHELHSAKLIYLGAALAMKGFCREFGEHHKFEIEFESRDLPRQLPPDVSLCLFRVLQEALHNAAKHSGVKRFDVQLWGTSGNVHLTISDLGSGFDTEAAMKGRGLGITSMQERLKLVKGELTITSHPKSGTSIHARVPLELEDQSARAAG
jgi:PAS domain S-box-containing protein